MLTLTIFLGIALVLAVWCGFSYRRDLIDALADNYRLRTRASRRDQDVADLSVQLNEFKAKWAGQAFKLASTQTELEKAKKKWAAVLASQSNVAPFQSPISSAESVSHQDS